MLLIVETPLFTKQILALATDEEYRALQQVLVANPATGARVIYYWRQQRGTIFMLVAYRKSVKTNLSPAEISTLRELVKALGR